MVSRLVSLLLPSTPTVSPEVVIYPHEGQIMSHLCLKLPRCFHLSMRRSPNHKNRSLGPTWSITSSNTPIHKAFSLSLHHLPFPVLTPLKRAQPSYQSSLHTKPAPTSAMALFLSLLLSQVFSWLSLSSSLCSKLTRLIRPSLVYLLIQNCNCPSMTLCPFPGAIFPHNTHPFYSIEVIWLLGLFLQSVMSTFEYKLHENGDFCLYCSLGLEKYLIYSRCSVNTSWMHKLVLLT